jgi:methyltransferase OMS1
MLARILGGSLVFSSGVVGGAYLFSKDDSDREQPTDSSTSADSLAQHDAPLYDVKASDGIYNSIARDYDGKVHMDEFFMGMLLLRRYILSYARGRTLEVSTGTGRNLTYYHGDKVETLTCSDKSREMLLEATEKAKKECMVKNINFCIADVLNLTDAETIGSNSNTNAKTPETSSRYGPLLRDTVVFPESHFDTVVDTFGLCSCEDPVKAIKEMMRALKPGGFLILLEHGRGTWDFVNSILKSQEKNHFKRWGCHFNRDIVAIIEQITKEEDASIINLQRWHFGTTVACVVQKKEH